jgi:hypothetical protein
MECKRCGHDVPRNADHCPKCRSYNPATGTYPDWTCSCGYRNGKYNKCYRCGARRPYGR